MQHLARIGGFGIWLAGGFAAGLGLSLENAAAQDTNEIESIVTITKRETTEQSVAAGVDVLQGPELDFRKLDSVQDMQVQIPSLLYGEVLGNPQISIRGVGLPLTTGDAEQGVATHVDGVFIARPTVANLIMGDLERIEVLRGPQGTLYGRNATGGIINYVTRKPTESFEAGGVFGYGSFDNIVARGYVSGPVVEDRVLVRLFGMTDQNDGYVDNLFNGTKLQEQDTTGGRAAIRFLPADNITIDIQGFYIDDDGSYSGAEALTDAIGTAVVLPSPPGTFDTRPFIELNDFDNMSERETWGFAANIEADLGGITIRSVTGYIEHDRLLQHDAEFTAVSLGTVQREDRSQTFSQELNLSGSFGNGGVDWILGAFYFEEDFDTRTEVRFPGLTLPFERDEKSTSVAVFADVTVSVSDRLRLVGGIRASWDDKKGTVTNIIDPDCFAGQPFDQSFNRVTPKAAIEFDAADDILIYVQYQRGTKPGGANSNSCNNLYEDETIDAFEGGLKSVLLDGQLTVNAAVFYYDYTDLQTFRITPMISSEVLNAPKASILGVEAEVVARLSDTVTFNVAATYLDAEYDEFSDTDIFAFGFLAPEEDLSGNRLNRAPKFVVTAGLEVSWPVDLGPLTGITVRGEIYHSSAYFLRRFNRPFDRQKAYTLGNFYLSLDFGDQFQLRGFVKNVGNTAYVITLFDNTSSGQINGVYGPPRTWGFELAADF